MNLYHLVYAGGLFCPYERRINPIKAELDGHSGIQTKVWHAHHFIFFLMGSR